MAGAVMSVIPPIVVYILFQKYWFWDHDGDGEVTVRVGRRSRVLQRLERVELTTTRSSRHERDRKSNVVERRALIVKGRDEETCAALAHGQRVVGDGVKAGSSNAPTSGSSKETMAMSSGRRRPRLRAAASAPSASSALAAMSAVGGVARSI